MRDESDHEQLHKALEQHGASPVPPPSPTFLDDLESSLRAEFAAHTSRRQRLLARIPRLAIVSGLAALVVIGGLVYAARDGDMPVSVIDESGFAAEPQTSDGGIGDGRADDGGTDGDTQPTIDEAIPLEPTPTAPAQSPPVSSTDEPAASPPTPSVTPSPTAPTDTSAPTAVPDPATTTPVPGTTVQPVPSPTPGTPLPQATPVATAVPTITAPPVSPSPAPTVQPRPTVTQTAATPTATVIATREPATATPEPELEAFEAVCEVRTSGEAIGVVCTWDEPPRPPAGYVVMRSKNGAEAVVVSRQPSSDERVFVDRQVASGDRVIYLVRAVNENGVAVADSGRVAVTL